MSLRWWWHVRAFPDSAASHAGGRVSLTGNLTGIENRVEPRPILAKGPSVHGIDVDSLAMLERMNTGLASSGMWPVIANVLPLNATADA
jgi:hypothetical protein